MLANGKLARNASASTSAVTDAPTVKVCAEHHYEETRAKINELFQRVKAPGQNDNGAWIEAT